MIFLFFDDDDDEDIDDDDEDEDEDDDVVNEDEDEDEGCSGVLMLVLVWSVVVDIYKYDFWSNVVFFLVVCDFGVEL